MTNFVALYRGNTIAEAQMIAVSADPELVVLLTHKLLQAPVDVSDVVLSSLAQSKRGALRLIQREARHAPQQ